MKIVGFKVEHLSMIQPRAVEQNEFLVCSDVLSRIYEAYPENKGFTLIEDDIILACGGVYKLFDNVGEAWILGSDNIPSKKILFTKSAMKGLMDIINSGMFHRIQSIVRVDFYQAIQFINLLGFKIEGKLKKYAPDGTDCFIYRLGGL